VIRLRLVAWNALDFVQSIPSRLHSCSGARDQGGLGVVEKKKTVARLSKTLRSGFSVERLEKGVRPTILALDAGLEERAEITHAPIVLTIKYYA